MGPQPGDDGYRHDDRYQDLKAAGQLGQARRVGVQSDGNYP